ncbi:MAG: 23S rRNA (pseudouridine(1915)-N(3))-methyltransferase RlmH [Muribaculaceae bacterium]|nr:23S rRNA (pseudouridine(1915)-N(3))-methyltransferase RlmH [Muribaculaceae bacterium]MDE6540379.1 23S rRNA (pseudouridine(1915)-N(3))-methyltransferase RlmH [Muribaculaceae bacterium]
MKIQLIVTGRTRDEALRSLVERYASRTQRYVPFEMVELPDVRTTRATTEAAQKQAEGQQMLKYVHPSDHLVLLDEHGRQMTSREFAGFIDKKMSTLPRNLIFAVGGPYGFSDEVRRRADGMLGLSAMTFSHEMVRPFFVEQIYRAMTILRGEPYHHD